MREIVERFQRAGMPFDAVALLVVDFHTLQEELVQSAMKAEFGMREPSTLDEVGLMVLAWCRPELLEADDDR